jgi:hypothetical protein
MQVLLGMADSVSEDQSVRKQFYVEISGSTFAGFLTVLQNPNFAKNSGQPSVIGQVSSFLERIRGLVRASISDESFIFESVKPFLTLLPDLMTLYKDHPVTVVTILKLYRDFAEFQVENLDEPEMEAFFTSVISLFQKFSQFFVSKFKTMQQNSRFQELTERELYADLICMLKFLLISVTFMTSHPGGEKVIFFGISCILPLISQEMLQYPKLARHYYGLLHNVFTEFPFQTASLEPNFFKMLTESLKLGLGK